MPEMIERMTTVVDKAVRLAQEANRHKGLTNVYCVNGSHHLFVSTLHRPSFRDAIGIAKKYLPHVTSTEMYMRDIREGEES